jgi:hypothetical protein
MIKIEVKIKEGNDGVIISRKVMSLDGTEAEDMFASSIAGLVDEVMDNVEAEIEEEEDDGFDFKAFKRN